MAKLDKIKKFFEEKNESIKGVIEILLYYALMISILSLLEGDFEFNELLSTPFILYDVYISVLMASLVLLIILAFLCVFIRFVLKILDLGVNMTPLSGEKSVLWLSKYFVAFFKRGFYYAMFYMFVMLLLVRQIKITDVTSSFALACIVLSIAFMLRFFRNLGSAELIQGVVIGIIFSGFILIFTGNAVGRYTETGFENILFLTFAVLDMLLIEVLQLPKILSRLKFTTKKELLF